MILCFSHLGLSCGGQQSTLLLPQWLDFQTNNIAFTSACFFVFFFTIQGILYMHFHINTFLSSASPCYILIPNCVFCHLNHIKTLCKLSLLLNMQPVSYLVLLTELKHVLLFNGFALYFLMSVLYCHWSLHHPELWNLEPNPGGSLLCWNAHSGSETYFPARVGRCWKWEGVGSVWPWAPGNTAPGGIMWGREGDRR